MLERCQRTIIVISYCEAVSVEVPCSLFQRPCHDPAITIRGSPVNNQLRDGSMVDWAELVMYYYTLRTVWYVIGHSHSDLLFT
jgi:hypothetical protein